MGRPATAMAELDWLPADWCFDCGAVHIERLAGIVRRMGPISIGGIRAEYPHLYGPPTQEKYDVNAQRIYRALRKLGATHDEQFRWSLR